MQSELYKSEPRDSTASNGTAHQHSQAADADDELLLLRGKATTARELQYSIELGKQVRDVGALRAAGVLTALSCAAHVLLFTQRPRPSPRTRSHGFAVEN